MCGIASIFVYDKNAQPVDRTELMKTLERMTCRGPDGCGDWISTDGRIGMGHRRLAIIDLSLNGSQPMTNTDGSLVVTYNGEIYNFKKLRRYLEEKGYQFRSNSDTEVLLHLYSLKGRDMVKFLRGMFAFVIWDKRNNGIFLARDTFGIKPLYYADDGKTFRAASQVKALLAGGAINRTPEAAGHVGFFLWGYVPEPFTLYRGIRALPAGTSLWIGSDGTKHLTAFFNIREEFAKARLNVPLRSPADARRQLRDTLADSVQSHLLADVPVGVFLSAGIDSTTLASLAAETAQGQLRTVTLGFKEFVGTRNDEVPLAEAVARHIGSVHKTIWVEQADFHDEMPRLLDSMDQPTIDGVNTYFISRAAKESGLKVAISGLGGDELFGGYPSFRQIPQLVKAMLPFACVPQIGKGFRLVTAPLLKRFTSPKYAGIFEYGTNYGGAYLLRRGMYMPWELPDVLSIDMVQEGWRDLDMLHRLDETIDGLDDGNIKVSALEMEWYMRCQLLRDADWASMAHSLELRVPLVDMELFHIVAPMLFGISPPGKKDVALTPNVSLPHDVLVKRKTGFSVPVRDWLLGKEASRGLRGNRAWAIKVYGELWQ
jgi:asparagine synthase (glutamine-hydrolysing)